MDQVCEKPRDRGRETGSDSYDRTREKERLPETRGKDDEVDWREREKRRHGDRRPNGRASLSEQAEYVDQEYERRKGDTFPRMARPSKDKDGRILLPVHERERLMGIPREMLYESERDRERERRRYRDMDVQSERERARYKEDLRRNDIRRLVKDEPERQREREKECDSKMKDRRRESYPGVNDHWSVNERERDREGDRYRQRDREGRYNLRETESFSDKEWRVGRHREADRNRKRDTKSEGDSDGERGKEGRRKDDSKREPRHYRSEEDSETQQMLDRIRERDRRRQREAERRRELAMQREREAGYQDRKDEHSERCSESERDRMRDTREKRRDYSDRDAYTYTTERIRYKEEERSRCLEQAEIEEREKRRRESRETERSKHRPRAERTSGCDVENERRRGTRDNLKDREGERGDRQKVKERGDRQKVEERCDRQKVEERCDRQKVEERCDRQKVEERGDRQKVEERMEKEQKGMNALREEEEGGRKEINTGKTKLKKMWLEPQSRKDSSLEEEYIEREKAREKYIQRYRGSKTTGESEKERIACDREAMEPELQMERENLNDNIKEIDREERRGNSRYGGLENEEGSEGESEGERDRVMSADDGFVTVSSGGDDAEEDDFEDCKEFWDGGVDDDLSGQSKCMQEEMKNPAVNDSEDHMGKKGPLTVFCVIGQTLPRSQTKPAYADNMDEEATNQHQVQDNQGEVNGINVNEPSENDKYTEENIDRAMGDLTLSSKEDSHDTKWEGGGSYDLSSHNVILLEEPMIPPNESLEKDTQPFPSEPLETLRPCSDIAAIATENSSENTLQDKTEGIGVTVEILNTDNTWDTSEEGKQHSTAPHLKWANSVVKEILGPSSVTRGSVPHIDMQTNTQTEGTRDMHDWREEKELLGTEVEQQGGMETESNDGSEDDLLDPSSVQHTLSSEGEVESERGETVAENTEKVKEAVLSSSSFRDLGNEARIRRRGFRKTTEKNKECGEEEEVGRDRRTRIFNVSDQDEDDDFSFSWSEVDLRKVTESLSRTKKRNSKFFNSQLYQEYSEVVQNREILLSHSDSIAISRDPSPIRSSSSPHHSPKLPQRPLPPLPAVHLHPHTLSQSNSFKSLVVPQKSTNRPPSPRLSFSPSSTTLWQDLPGVRSSSELGELSEDERRLQEVRFEVVTSEASYCRSLDIVVENFVMSKQLSVLLSSQDKNWLFSRLSDVRAISHSFLSQLEERVESDILHFTVCDIIIKHCPRFRKVHVPYLTNQSYQDKTYQRLMDGNPEFRRVVEKLERNPVCQRLPLRSFLILPFQRITRLKLLVQNIVKRTAPKTKDEAQAIKAMKLLEKMIQDSNESICQMKNIESLLSLNAKVDFDCRTLPLISQSRRLVREGPATELRDFSLKETERNVYLHLFNDYLLLSLRKEGGRFTVIDHAPVSELRVENCRFKLHSLQKNLFRLYMVNKAVLLRTDTQADKLRWISALSRPYPEIDFSAVQDFPQVQCIRAYVAQQPDELNLEKADVLLVHQQSTDGWVEGTRLSDRQRCWAPDSHLETIASDKAKKRNLLDTMKIATAAL